MRVKLVVNHTREVKKMSYKILRRLHDLEKGRRFARVYSTMCKVDACVLVCLLQLRDILENSITPVASREEDIPVKRYLDSLNRLIEEVRCSAANNTRLRNRALVKLLTAHTALFNALLRNEIKIAVSREAWIDFVLPAIMIWGNKL
jgi:hypothetical protein